MDNAINALLHPNSIAILGASRGFPEVERTYSEGAAAGSGLKELDINPVLGGSLGVTAVDWLMVLN